MTFDDVDNELIKRKIKFDSSVQNNDILYYYYNELLVAEAIIKIHNNGISQWAQIEVFEYKNKLLSTNI